MTEKLVAGENVEIRGFGSFTVRHYDSYIGRKPKTGEQFEVKPKKLPFFKVGKDLKQAVDAGRHDCEKKRIDLEEYLTKEQQT